MKPRNPFEARPAGVVCLVGIKTDPVLRAVESQLRRRGADSVLFDIDAYPAADRLTAHCRADGTMTGSVTASGRTVRFSEMRSAYVRLLSAPAPADPAGEPALLEAARFYSLDHMTRTWGVPTVGLLKPCATNVSKPYQTALIASELVRVPETLVTTRPASARAFAKARQTSFKSLSAERSICVTMDAASEKRLPLLRRLPAQFQQYVRGLDIRVHVVGEFVHALAIETAASDYRYSQRHFKEPARTREFELPAPVREELVTLTARLGLAVGGIDLRLTEAGEYYCFEVNPTPGFAYFDPQPAAPIANAIAELLVGGRP